jgi:hypothetical protein
MRGTDRAQRVDLGDGPNTRAANEGGAAVVNDFLSASLEAAKTLEVARQRHQQATARADARLEVARQRHRRDLAAAASLETTAWTTLMQVPGMTIATAARIAGTSESIATRWVARGRQVTQ